MINDFSNLDFSKYKRVFALGCSFTAYRWPTWADMIGRSQCEHAEFINLGRAGAGNPYIVTQLVQAHNKFKFCETDLVMVMFTNFTREDRYINKQWITPGNIYTQGFYPDEYIEKYSDVKGYAIRDFALMELAYEFIQNINSDSIVLFSVPPNFHGSDYQDVIKLHQNFINQMPVSLYESVVFDPNNQGYWKPGAYYFDPGQPHLKEKYGDYHPGPLKYYQYLINLGIKLDDRVKDYADNSSTTLSTCNTLSEIQMCWPGYENFSSNII